MGPFFIYHISESAVTLEYGSEISIARHRELVALSELILQDPFTGLNDCSVAYNSLSIFFDPLLVYQQYGEPPLGYVSRWLEKLAQKNNHTGSFSPKKEHQMPVCYEAPYAPDLAMAAQKAGLSPEDLIRLHSSESLYVFMIGFSPGFPYMGVLPSSIDIPRKQTPSLKVQAGSVGIAGRQTGIYPFDSPGGWNIIGRTPIRLFDVNHPDLCYFESGDMVRFTPIDSATFHYLNQYEDH